MNYIEISSNLINGWESKKEETINWIIENEFVHDELYIMLLCVLMFNTEAKIRTPAIKIIRKIGPSSVEDVLKSFTKALYKEEKNAEEKFAENIVQYENMENFDLVLFSKYVFLNNTKITSAKNYFFKYATNEQIDFLVVNNCYSYHHPEYVILSFGGSYNKYTVEGRVFEQIWRSTSKISEKIREITLRTDDVVSLGRISNWPIIKELKLICEFDEFPTDIFKLKSLQNLMISCNSTMIPNGLGKLENLKKVYINAPISNIPEDLLSHKTLEDLTLRGTKIKKISPKISGLQSLTSLTIFKDNTELSTIPIEVFDLPNLSEYYKDKLKVDFTSSNPYLKLYVDFKYYINWFSDIPVVAKLIKDFEEGKVERFPELLLATTRCYYDSEHGLELNNLPKALNLKCEIEKILKVNELIKVRFVDERITEKEFEKIEKALNKVEWFDSGIFLTLVKEMSKYVNTIYPHAKW